MCSSAFKKDVQSKVKMTRFQKYSLGFWMRNSKRFPKLFKLALTLIAIQASSGESERMFSVSGWHTAGKKNRLCKDQLERKTFLSVNKDLLRCQIFKKLMKTKKVKS